MTLRELMDDEWKSGRSYGINEGIKRGIAKGKAEFVLDLLQDLPGSLPEEIRARIFSEKNNEVLRKYLHLASSADSVEGFIQRM